MPDPLLSLIITAILTAVATLLFWPERGLVARWQVSRQMTTHVLGEDALKHIHKCAIKGRRPTLESVAGALHISTNQATAVLATLQAQQLLLMTEDDIRLTPTGQESALHIIRAHRLWERYLAEETGFREAEWHGRAEQLEHRMTPEQANALAAQLNFPAYDPHGDPIPTAEGHLSQSDGHPLTSLGVDTPGQIVHLEDEPDVVYAQLVAEGLYPGMPVRIMEITPERVRFWANGDEHVLAPIVAANISVVPLPEETAVPLPEGDVLSDLQPGEKGQVLSISPACRGAERRRFLDLGLLPGTVVWAEMRSPSGDPTAYLIRGALIALRQQQANYIRVKRLEAQPS